MALKVMYLASSTPDAETLDLEREITSLQRRAQNAGNEDVRFLFLPDVKLEELGLELTKERPDILHISVHGSRSGLWFATQDGRDVELSANQLMQLLPLDHLPRLILLNACDSDQIASHLASLPLVAIGSTAPITNQAAIASATIFYDRLLRGSTIDAAYRAMDAIVHSLEERKVRFELQEGKTGLRETVLHRGPELVAKLRSGKPGVANGSAFVHLGFTGCPVNTTQVVFFTDDPTFIINGKSLEFCLTEVIRDLPRGGEVWTDEWNCDGDFRITACAITADGRTISHSSMLSDAVERYPNLTQASPAYVTAASVVTQFLRDNVGAGLVHWKPHSKRETKVTEKLAK